MTKLKNPLLALDARGTLAGSITLQNNFYQTFARTKPIPTDPKSLAQIYQRWDYQDALFEWSLLSDAQKAAYRPLASRKKWPPLAYFIFDYLHTLPSLAGRWHLDEPSGNVAHDSSKNTNHGTYFGTAPTTGIIGGARYFDGIDDRIGLPLTTLPTDTTAFTFAIRARRTELNRLRYLAFFAYPFYLRFDANNKVRARLRFHPPSWGTPLVTTETITDTTTFHSIALSWDGTWLTIFLDGVLVKQSNVDAGRDLSPLRYWNWLGRGDSATAYLFKGILDHACLWTKAQPTARILTHSQRSYP